MNACTDKKPAKKKKKSKLSDKNVLNIEPKPPQYSNKATLAVPEKETVHTAQPINADNSDNEVGKKNIDLINKLEAIYKEESVKYNNIYQVLEEIEQKNIKLPVLEDQKCSAFYDSVSMLFMLAALFVLLFQPPVILFHIFVALMFQSWRIYDVGKNLLLKFLLGAAWVKTHNKLLKFFNYCDSKLAEYASLDTTEDKNDPRTPPTVKRLGIPNTTHPVEDTLARSDLLYDENKKIVRILCPNERQTNFNYHGTVKVGNDDNLTQAEIDCDSHFNLIAEDYFKEIQQLGHVKFLDEPCPKYSGLGTDSSSLVSKYPPVLIDVQIGRVLLTVRFVVCSYFYGSKGAQVLLGSDVLVKNNISTAKYSDGHWYLVVGAVDAPVSKTKVYISNKVVASSTGETLFAPLEIKRIQVHMSDQILGSNFVDTDLRLKPPDDLKYSPFRIVEDPLRPKNCLTVQNTSLFPVVLPPDLPLAEADLGGVLKQIQNNIKMDGEVLSEDEINIELMLEPGIDSPTIIDKNVELDYIRDHKTIPNTFKPDLIEFLEKRSSLFSGEEYSKDSFPESKFQHDVELTDDIKQLKCRPFPVSGIRLAQLRQDINNLVQNGILSLEDSDFCSPCFYVLKKTADGKQAAKGRLCFDYRKINQYVRMKNFPLANTRNFFDEAGKFKYFCIIDITNAFLNIKLTPRARDYLAIITPFGIYKPNRSPFGLKTSPSAFCFALNLIIGDLNFVNFYMDDIHVGGRTEKEMFENLKTVLQRLYENNLKIRLSKTKFFVSEIKCLGVIFSSTGKKLDPSKVQAIKEFGKLDSVKKVQKFLGMMCYLSSFIPHFSTACAPLYSLLKNQKQKTFQMTKEAEAAYAALKQYVSRTTMLYHIDLESPLYLSVDASNVGAGGFLYQVVVYPKNKEGYSKMMADHNFIIEGGGASPHLLPGVSPGKQTPIVDDFLKDKSLLAEFDTLDTLRTDRTMTEKIKIINDNYVLHVRPIAFYSKTFSEAQTLRYVTMEKEFLSIMMNVMNFKQYLQAAKITYILTDSQPVCWALRHKDDHVKLSRWILKLFELNINIVISHVSGVTNSVADWLSRLYYVPQSINKDSLGPKSAQHIDSPFKVLDVLTPDDILKGFTSELVTPCSAPEMCHLNVNSQLFRGIGPFQAEYSCVKKVVVPVSEKFGFSPEVLNKHLTYENILKKQKKDVKLNLIIEALLSGKDLSFNNYFLQKGILHRKFETNKKIGTTRPSVIVLPKSLIMFALASAHFQSHAGSKKLCEFLRLQYFWKDMYVDCQKFSAGCILCQLFKSPTQGPNEVGTPRVVLGPRQAWQMDVVSGLVPVQGKKSFLNIICMYSGYTIAVPLKHETSEEIASVLDNHVIKCFGIPKEISSDNAANLNGPAIKKLLKLYNIHSRQTVPYSPTSHSLIEISNRYITQLARIFADQFSCNWTDTLTIATVIFNTIPRPQFLNHSPHFMMFGEEMFQGQGTAAQNHKNLDLNEYLKDKVNEQIFVKIVREFLLKHRLHRNQQKSKRYLSFPTGTLVLLRDKRPRAHKKLKPLFYKLPLRVVTEFRCTVYVEDLFGRVSKQSKNNIRPMAERSAELFGKLPDSIKAVLGDEINAERWLQFKNDGLVPTYLNDIEIQTEIGPVTRGTLPVDSHLILNDNNSEPVPIDEDDEDLDDLLDDVNMKKLQFLHDNNLLTDPQMTLRDVPSLYRTGRELARDGGAGSGDIPTHPVDPDDLVADVPELELVPPPPVRLEPGLDLGNIIPKARRRVRFNLPYFRN